MRPHTSLTPLFAAALLLAGCATVKPGLLSLEVHISEIHNSYNIFS